MCLQMFQTAENPLVGRVETGKAKPEGFFPLEFIHFHRIGETKTFLVHNLSIVLLYISCVLKQNNYLQKIAG